MRRISALKAGWLLTSLAVLAVFASGISIPGAKADSLTSGAGKYAINLPSSVLAAAAVGGGMTVGNGRTDGEVGGMLADTAPFNSEWNAFVAEYGPDLADVTESDAATIATMEAQFAAPATPLQVLSKASVAITAIKTGFALGPYFDSVVGIDDAKGLCVGGPADAVGSIIATLTSVNCPRWQMTSAFEAQANHDADPVVTGGRTCSLAEPNQCATAVGSGPEAGQVCFHLEGSGTVWLWFSGGSTITWGEPTSEGSGVTPGSGTGCSFYDDNSGNFPIGDLNFATGHDVPLESYCVGSGTFTDNCGLSSPEQVVVTPGNPKRHFVCTITMTDGSSFSENSTEFFETDTTIPRPEAPGIPAGETPESTSCTELGGPNPVVVIPPTPTTAAYKSWSVANPNCTNGSCMLDLKKEGASCFTQDITCDGWVSDPNRGDDYQCFYGGKQVSVSECYVYGTTFSAIDRHNGHAYADPSNGAITDDQTSTSDTDQLTSDLIDRGEETWGPTSSGYSLGLEDAAAEYVAAYTIATFCVAQGISSACRTTPIFTPGSNVLAASQHDLDAITGLGTRQFDSPVPMSPFLTYAPIGNRVPSGWYSSTPPCVSGTYGAPQNECDEYPFASTATAGQGASLRPINLADNRNEGQYLNHFYNACGLNSSTSDGTFLTVPTPTLPTSEWCAPE